jgi:TPP-dependent pyruvate/acetoin dehydrogenase alpha subunit
VLRDDVYIEMFRRMMRIRHFEETVTALQSKGEIPGSLHTSIGQEAEIVGATMALRIDDYMVGNHRSHGHPIGKGSALRPLMAELLARESGVCRGKGGSMHLSDFSVGSLGETSVVGSGLPVATGAALGAKMQGLDRVCLCFFGDGASNEGTFHESLNLAAIWRLPAIYLCENNMYGVSTSARAVIAVENIAQRGASYNIPAEIVDGQDVLVVYDAVVRAILRARGGDGPTLIEAKTYRYDDHAVNMGLASDYRTKQELAFWRTRDPILLFREKLTGELQQPISRIEAVISEVKAEVEDAVAFARASAYPLPDEAFTNVYSNPFDCPRDAF